MRKIPSKVPLSQINQIAKLIAEDIKGGEVFALNGPLGSGKTAFTKALGKELGVKQNIPSPTFVIMQEFETGRPGKNNKKLLLYHLDLYRTKSFNEVKGLGITEWWGYPETITVIEWADKIKSHLPPKAISITFERDIDEK